MKRLTTKECALIVEGLRRLADDAEELADIYDGFRPALAEEQRKQLEDVRGLGYRLDMAAAVMVMEDGA
jgi:hypothetical protein